MLAGRLRAVGPLILRAIARATHLQRADDPARPGGVCDRAMARSARSKLLDESGRALRMGSACRELAEHLAACGVAGRSERSGGAGSRAARAPSHDALRTDHRDTDGPGARAGAVRERRRCALPALRYAGVGTPIPDENPAARSHHHGDRTVAESAAGVPAAGHARGARECAPDAEIGLAIPPPRRRFSAPRWRPTRWSRHRARRMPSASSPSAPIALEPT